MWSITWNINEKSKVDQRSFHTYEQADVYAKYYKTIYEKHLVLYKLKNKSSEESSYKNHREQPVSYEIWRTS